MLVDLELISLINDSRAMKNIGFLNVFLDIFFFTTSTCLSCSSVQVSLGCHQYLFTVTVNPADMPCFCLRHDVDALVWQPRPEQPDNMWEHVATFNALGKSQENVFTFVILLVK